MSHLSALRFFLSFSVVGALVGCQGQNLSTEELLRAGSLSPRPAQPSTTESQIKRFRGQDEFLNPDGHSRGLGGAFEKGAANEAPSKSGGDRRAIQEADVFKIGKPGSKVLYLLNNYRGLQVVDFSQGAEKPILLGRVPASGNFPDDMYYDAQNERIVVLERVYSSADGGRSRIVVYDVAQSAKPAIVQTLEFEGTLSDSRLVGDVLYVVGTYYPRNYWWGDGGDRKLKGFVHSFSLGKTAVSQVEQYTLSLPSAQSENLNIVETEVNGSLKYYLLAVLSESGGGWWDRESQVEVVDISDPKGKVLPVMTAYPRGQVRERSQTLIKDGHLVVASNYFIPSANRTLGRIAVEAFVLPQATSEVISQDEANFRQLWLEREMAKYSGTDPEGNKEVLLADKNFGLKGRFVKGTSALKKLVADSQVTVGDTQGLSANLQDVRVANGLLYAFWVPQNNVDPLDIFDLSDLSNGIKYSGRLQFDGWIQRAMPVEFSGRQFVIGLGWVMPAVNNDQGRRYPQAMLFEIRRVNGQPKAFEVGQLTLKDPNVWIDLNAPDRFMELKFDSQSTGEIMFSVYSWSNGKSEQGGKLLRFDLASALSGGAVFAEGPTLVGEAGWLRRVFTNTEINRVNTFSDEALGVFADTSGATGSTSVQAVATLELARNIRAYAKLNAGAQMSGVQIVSRGSYFRQDVKSETELRLVDPKRADAEKGEAETLTLKGEFEDVLEMADGSLLVLTKESVYLREEATENSKSWMGGKMQTTYRLWSVLKGPLEAASVFAASEWIVTGQSGWSGGEGWRLSIHRPWRAPYQANLLLAPDGRVLVQDSEAIRLVSTGLQLHVEALGFVGCKTRSDRSIQYLGGQPYLVSSEIFEDPQLPGVALSKKFLTEISIAGTQVTCGLERNIPGTPVAKQGDFLITDDSWADQIKTETSEFGGVTSVNHDLDLKLGRTVTELKVDRAVLTDQRESDRNIHESSGLLPDGQILILTSEIETYTPWRVPTENKLYQISYLAVDNQGFLTEEKFSEQLKIGSWARVSLVAPDRIKGRSLAVVTGDVGTQVLSVGPRVVPTVLPLAKIDSQFVESKPTTVLPSGFWYGDDAIHHTLELRSFEFARGLGGVDQVLVK